MKHEKFMVAACIASGSSSIWLCLQSCASVGNGTCVLLFSRERKRNTTGFSSGNRQTPLINAATLPQVEASCSPCHLANLRLRGFKGARALEMTRTWTTKWPASSNWPRSLLQHSLTEASQRRSTYVTRILAPVSPETM